MSFIHRTAGHVPVRVVSIQAGVPKARYHDAQPPVRQWAGAIVSAARTIQMGEAEVPTGGAENMSRGG